MPKPSAFNVERLITAVAKEHRLILKPDDAAFAIVTMNRLILEESLEAVRATIVEDLAKFKETAQWAHSRAESAIEAEVRSSARALRDELQRDICTARLRAAEITQEVKEKYEKPMSRQRFAVVVLAAVLLILCGVWVGRFTASW